MFSEGGDAFVGEVLINDPMTGDKERREWRASFCEQEEGGRFVYQRRAANERKRNGRWKKAGIRELGAERSQFLPPPSITAKPTKKPKAFCCTEEVGFFFQSI